jgi:hypothetical protein
MLVEFVVGQLPWRKIKDKVISEAVMSILVREEIKKNLSSVRTSVENIFSKHYIMYTYI